MFRVALAFALAAPFCLPTSAEEKKPEKKPTVDLRGDLKDAELGKKAPPDNVIVSQKVWDALVKAWDIKDPPKVDFEKELLVIATTVGSRLSVSGTVDDKGDLKVRAISTADIRPGLRYRIVSFSRAGVKTVNGKELPKE